MTATTKTTELRSEAAIYAEGTSYTTDDLVRAYNSYVAEAGEDADGCQRFFERFLAGEVSRELTNAINDYGSEASREHLGGMGKEDWQGWVSHATDNGVEATVKAIDAYYAD